MTEQTTEPASDLTPPDTEAPIQTGTSEAKTKKPLSEKKIKQLADAREAFKLKKEKERETQERNITLLQEVISEVKLLNTQTNTLAAKFGDFVSSAVASTPVTTPVPAEIAADKEGNKIEEEEAEEDQGENTEEWTVTGVIAGGVIALGTIALARKALYSKMDSIPMKEIQPVVPTPNPQKEEEPIQSTRKKPRLVSD